MANPQKEKGYFPLWRKITEWGWYRNGNTMRVFLHLLLLSNHKERNYMTYKILPGQCVTGRKKLSADLGLSEQSIRTALNHLKSTNELTSKNYNRFSIITINNYSKYTISTSEPTSQQPASNQPATTPNNKNNVKNDKNIVEDDFPHLKDSSFKELWNSWLEVRKIKKVPNTDRALKIALGKLQVHPLDTAIQMLEKAVEGGWKGIYELKEIKEGVKFY